MKKEILDIFLICFFIILIVGFVFAFKYYRSEGNQCISDPLSYAHNKLIESNPQAITIKCSCDVFTGLGYQELCGKTSCPLEIEG